MAVVLAGIFLAFCLFYYLDQKRKIRNEQKHKKNREKFKQLLDQLKRSSKNNEQ
jgi:hypothetical protein